MNRRMLGTMGTTAGAAAARAARVALPAAALWLAAAAPGLAGGVELPARLADTGLYVDFATRAIDPANLPFSPQYPLWTDGAAKRRWIRIPAGAAIDASDPDHWDFPVGTRVWKEFAFSGRPVETRYMERNADGSWLYATYRWSADSADATLAPERGVRAAFESSPGVAYDIPGVWDCRACHEGSPSRVLGFGALQLSSDRDPLAPNRQEPEPGSVDLPALAARGLVRKLPVELLRTPPRVDAPTPTERAALGYLHGNCSGCHNPRGPLADLGFSLQVELAPGHRVLPAALTTGAGRLARFQAQPGHPMARISPGAPDASLVARRMASREPLMQMPPLGTHRADEQGLAVVSAWIRELGAPTYDVEAQAMTHTYHPQERKQ